MSGHADVGAELSALLEQLEDAEAGTRRSVQRLVALLLDVHGAGLARLMELLAEQLEDPAAVLSAVVADPLVGDLLLLHDLDPRSAEERAAAALRAVTAAAPDRIGAVQLVAAYDHEVRLRLGDVTDVAAAAELAAMLRRTIAHAVPSAQVVIEDAPRVLPVLGAGGRSQA